MSAIYKRDLKRLFTGMIAPMFIAFLLLICGVFLIGNHLAGRSPRFEYSVPTIGFIFLLIVPVLTMQSFAAEKAEKTDNALYSLPISTLSVVCGKYLSMVTVLAISTAAMCAFPLILSLYGEVYFPTAYCAILAFFLMGCALISIGMFISTLTESQAIAAIVSCALFLLPYLLRSIIPNIPTTATASFIILLFTDAALVLVIWLLTKSRAICATIGGIIAAALITLFFAAQNVFESLVPNILDKFRVFDQMENYLYGVFDLKVLVYYISVVFMFGFFTVLSFDKKRWN